jgi:hypothetical protein
MQALTKALKAIGKGDAAGFFSKPEAYRGKAEEKALSLGAKYDAAMKDLKATLEAD